MHEYTSQEFFQKFSYAPMPAMFAVSVNLWLKSLKNNHGDFSDYNIGPMENPAEPDIRICHCNYKGVPIRIEVHRDALRQIAKIAIYGDDPAVSAAVGNFEKYNNSEDYELDFVSDSDLI